MYMYVNKYSQMLIEPRHEKIINVVSEQVHHKASCTRTEDG